MHLQTSWLDCSFLLNIYLQHKHKQIHLASILSVIQHRVNFFMLFANSFIWFFINLVHIAYTCGYLEVWITTVLVKPSVHQHIFFTTHISIIINVTCGDKGNCVTMVLLSLFTCLNHSWMKTMTPLFTKLWVYHYNVYYDFFLFSMSDLYRIRSWV